MALQLTTDQQKRDFIQAYWAPYGGVNIDSVMNNPDQLQRAVADAQEALDRNTRKVNEAIAAIANAEKEVAKGGVNSAGQPLVNLDAVIAENKAIIEEWMPGLQTMMTRYGQFVDTAEIDRFNSYAELANEAVGTNYPTLEGGSGQKVVTMQSAVDTAAGITPGDSGPPTMADFADIADPVARNAAYTDALNAYKGGAGVDTSTEKAWFEMPDGQITEANVGSSVVQGARRLSDEEVASYGYAPSGSSGTSAALGSYQSDIDAALEYIQNSTSLSPEFKALYSEVVRNWDPNNELNADNVIKEFENIQKSTIDPYYQGIINLATEGIKQAVSTTEKNRALELESEGINAAQAIKGTQADLEARGLTFSGEAINQLGAQSAYGEVIPFGGTTPIEGLVNTQNRLISTSSTARYEDTLKNLGLSAEEQLGTEGVSGLVPGYTAVGSVAGQIPTQKEAELGQTLGTLLDQQSMNQQQDELLDFTS